MSCRVFTCFAGSVFAVLCATSVVADSSSSEGDRPPAVSATNVTGSYVYGYADSDEDSMGPEHTHLGTGKLVVPISRSFGGVVSIDGGKSEQESFGWLGAPETHAIGVVGGLFWRNPESGYVALGYRWYRAELEVERFGEPVEKQTGHAGIASVGVFSGPLDAAFAGRYTRLKITNSFFGGTETEDEYSLALSVGWHPHDSVRIGLGGQWLHVPSHAREPRQATGALGLEWQPPLGHLRYVRLHLGATYGTIWQDVAIPVGPPAELDFYTVSTRVSFDWPGSTSLMEQLRSRTF